MEEPAEENVTKTSDNLEMAELNPDPVPYQDEEEDINRDWIHWNCVDYLKVQRTLFMYVDMISNIFNFNPIPPGSGKKLPVRLW